MTSFKVTKEGGVEINGADYAEGHVFTFDGGIPSHIQSFVDDGSIIEVDLSEKNENTMSDENEQKEAGEQNATAPGQAESETGAGQQDEAKTEGEQTNTAAGEEKAAE